MKSKPIIITTGDWDSIFYEIFFKSTKKNFISPLVLICSKSEFIKQIKFFKIKKKWRVLNFDEFDISKLDNKKFNIIDLDIDLFGKRFPINDFKKNYVKKSFEMAFKIIKNNYSNKFINGPINKSTFLNKKFPGITEYISNKFNKKKIGMLIYNKKLSVCPVTTHLPLKNVANSIDKYVIEEKIKLVDEFYIKYLKLKPRIAVVGLNPHCESILKVNEDEKILKPAIKDMKKKNINVKGPFSADTIFSQKNRGFYDVVIGMYHDQVLAPIKTLYEFDAINVTMGLPFLRATPDHGPNKEMVGKNLSNPTSLIRALEFLDKK